MINNKHIYTITKGTRDSSAIKACLIDINCACAYLEHHGEGGGVGDGGELGNVAALKSAWEEVSSLGEGGAHGQLLKGQTLLDPGLLLRVVLDEHEAHFIVTSFTEERTFVDALGIKRARGS